MFVLRTLTSKLYLNSVTNSLKINVDTGDNVYSVPQEIPSLNCVFKNTYIKTHDY